MNQNDLEYKQIPQEGEPKDYKPETLPIETEEVAESLVIPEKPEDKDRNILLAKIEAERSLAESKKIEGNKIAPDALLHGENAFATVKTQHTPSNKMRNAFMATKIALAGLFGMSAVGAKATTGPIHDATKNNIEAVATTDSLEKKPFQETTINETIGHLTLEGSIFIPQSDSTKEFQAFYFSDDGQEEHKLEDIIAIMAKKGYQPATGDQLRAIYDQNKTATPFNKKTAWLLALTPEGAADDARSNERVIVEKNGKIEIQLPTNAVFPTKNPQGLGKFEVKKNVGTEDYGFLFVKNTETK